jgi:hypothetical protein
MLPDLTGETFGRLKVIGLRTWQESGRRMWACVCECGEKVSVSTKSLRNGSKQSCGCLHRERTKLANTTHGQSVGYKRSREFTQWHNMMNRCSNAKSDRWKSYGERGVEVCERWTTFENFLLDMGKCPEGLTLERSDVNDGYSPDNCVWATRKMQSRNKTNTKWVTYQGVTKCLADWCEELGLKYGTVNYRLRSGWTSDEAFNGVRR